MRYLILFLLFPGLRDLIILAIYAAKIAVAKEDISGAICAGQTRFLAKMRGITRDDRQTAGVARRDLVIETIIAAVFWADGTGFKQRFELLDAFPQLILRQEC